ncbi:MAG: hypothetical protein AAFR96_13770, partial [Planctomycetota bacterium]
MSVSLELRDRSLSTPNPQRSRNELEQRPTEARWFCARQMQAGHRWGSKKVGQYAAAPIQ